MHSRILITLLIFLSGVAYAQFEGVMDMKVIGAGFESNDTIMYTMSVKKNLMATEVHQASKEKESGKFIFRGDKQVIWIIDEEEKTFMEISLKDDEKTPKPENKGKPEKSDVKVRKTGNKETILGYTAEEVIVEGEDQVTHIWGTAKLGNIYAGMLKSLEGMGDDEGWSEGKGWDEEMAKLNMFPLKIISKEDGKIILTQEVTRIEQKSLPQTMFEVPKGYKKQSFDFDMEKMMKQLQKDMKKDKEEDSDDPGINVDMEKLMKQLKDAQIDDADTSDGG